MEKYKDIIEWVKSNPNRDSFSVDEYNKGIVLLLKHTRNTFLCAKLQRSVPSKINKSLLHYNLSNVLKQALNSEQQKKNKKNIVIKTSGPGSFVPNNPIVTKPIIDKEVPKSMKELLMPDSIVKMKSRSGELFRKAGKLHRDLVERLFGKKKIDNKEKEDIKDVAVEIASLMDENVEILNKVDNYLDTGKIPPINNSNSKSSKLDNKDLSKLNEKELISKKKSCQVSLYRLHKKMKEQTDITKQKKIKSKIDLYKKNIERISKEIKSRNVV
jgi:hypothetical protein